jgi:hypothetical protein
MVFVDGPNADNQACAWGALNGFNTDEVKLAGVVVSPTAVNNAENAIDASRNIKDSRAVHQLHTARMAGLFARAGVEVPVFSGLDIEETVITSPIPHQAHVRHEDYDIYGDAHGEGRAAIAGDFSDALSYMERLRGDVHVVVGGPFSEIPELQKRPKIQRKLGYLAAQAGFALSQRAIYSKLAFNVDVDMLAALDTYINYPGEMYNVPSDITRHPSVTFKSAEELMRLGVHSEISDIFIRHRARAEERHKKEQLRRQAKGEDLRPYPALSVHDLQAVLALRQVLGFEKGLYEFAPLDADQSIANIKEAARLRMPDSYSPVITDRTIRSLGYRGLGMTDDGPLPGRYVVTAQDSVMYKCRAQQLLAPL